jgi:hypothetical protein
MGLSEMKKRDTCKKGHPMSGDNLIHKTVQGREVRECRTCANQRFRDKRKLKAANREPKPKGQRPKAVEPKEAVMAETPAQRTAQESAATIDPNEFLEAPITGAVLSGDLPAHIDPTGEGGKDDNLFAVCAGISSAIGAKLLLREVLRVNPDGTKTPIAFEQIRAGDRFTLLDQNCESPIENGATIYTANADAVTCDVDGNWMVTVDAYPGEPISTVLPSAADLDAVAAEQEAADATLSAEESAGIQAGLEDVAAGRVKPLKQIKAELNPDLPERLQPTTVQSAKPKPRIGCEHGFPNPALCPSCRANGRR